MCLWGKHKKQIKTTTIRHFYPACFRIKSLLLLFVYDYFTVVFFVLYHFILFSCGEQFLFCPDVQSNTMTSTLGFTRGLQ